MKPYGFQIGRKMNVWIPICEMEMLPGLLSLR